MNATQTQVAGGGGGGAVGIKETMVSLIIAFTLAFVFRGYVVEPYVIPTGSMAPTLKGAHESVTDPANGYTWEITPWFEQRIDPTTSEPLPQQGGRLGVTNMGSFEPLDPMTKEPVSLEQGTPLLSGDRIFVLRYVWPVFKPTRFDVVVFKDPQDPSRNFIKRLIGLPSEQIALIDGDVFVRKLQPDATSPVGVNTWTLPGWTIARKDERAQRTAWQTVFDSRYTPTSTRSGKPFVGPWVGGTPGWEIDGKASYTYKGSGATALKWNIEPDLKLDYGAFFGDMARAKAAREAMRRSWHLTDSYAFNETFQASPEKNAQGQALFFPVSDLKMAAGVEPAADGQDFACVLRTRGHEFRGRLANSGGKYQAIVEMREAPAAGATPGAWAVLDSKPIEGVMAAGKVTNVEFWHADQRLQMWVEGKLAASGEYDWNPEQRVARVFGKTLAEIIAQDSVSVSQGKTTQFGYGGAYCRPEPSMEISGPCTLHRVSMARDLYYEPVIVMQSPNGLFVKSSAGAYPGQGLDKDKILGEGQYFVCGDNSPLSADARAWQTVDPWVNALIDPTAGVVPEKLMIGKAFVVYFPAIHQKPILGAKIPVPNAGQVRWIW